MDPLAEESALLQFIDIILKNRRLILGLPTLFVLVAVPVLLASGRSYSSTGVFLPENVESGIGGLSSVASQLGIALPTQSGRSPQFYAELVRTPSSLRAIADSTFRGADQGTYKLAQLFEIEGETSEEVREGVVQQLATVVSTGVDPRTGAVRFGVRTSSPDLSHQIASALLAQLDAFNTASRRNRAAAERQFIDERLRGSFNELLASETRLATFLKHNRVYQNDPQLAIEQQRLSRDVRIQEQVYTSLAQTLERASIESARTTPTLFVVEAPTRPVFPDKRPMLLVVLMAGAFGLTLGIGAAVARDQLQRMREERPEEFARTASLARIWR